MRSSRRRFTCLTPNRGYAVEFTHVLTEPSSGSGYVYPFIDVLVEPGKEFTWTYTYDYYTLPAERKTN